MAKFTGTLKEFKRYVGPRLRNLVQTWTREHKGSVGACEICGSGEYLESAHVKGSNRNQIIEKLLPSGGFNETHTVDLAEFEAKFREEHEPLEKAILVLCHSCHGQYDSGSTFPDASNVSETTGEPKTHTQGGVLPIMLLPSPVTEFKKHLLSRKQANIVVWYADGRIEERQWDASAFLEASNVMGNLRSRPEFRQGNWQQAGIVKVLVKVQ